MKIFLRIFFVLMTLFVLVGGALFGTKIGLQLLQKSIHVLSGGNISIGEAEGKILGRFLLGDIRLKFPGSEIKVAKVDWNWSPLSLLRGALHVESLDVAGVVIRFTDSPKAPSKDGPLSLPQRLLPLGLLIDRATVASLQMQASDGGELIAFDTIDLQIESNGENLTIENFSVQGPDLGFTVLGTIDLDRNRRIDLIGSWRVINYGFHLVEGTFSASGPLASPHAEIGINRPADIRVEGDVTNLLEKPEWTAVLEAHNVDLEALIKHCPKIDLAVVNGQLSGNTEGYGGLVKAVGTWGSIDNMQLQSTITAGLMGIDFKALRIDREDGSAVAENAAINWKRLFDWEGHFHFKNFDPSHFFPWLPGKLNADLTSVGTVRDDLGVDVNFDVMRLDGTLREQPIAAVGKVVLTENDIRTEGMRVRSGLVEGSARIEKAMISWVDRLRWSGEVRFDNFNPAGLYPGFPGQISGVLAGEGFLDSPAAEGYLKISDVSGQLRGNALLGNGEISLVDGTIKTSGLFLQSGSSQFVVQGQAGDAFALDCSFTSPDLGTLLPEASGTVQLLGRLRGSLEAPLFEAELHGERLSLFDSSFARLDAKIHSQMGENDRLQGTFSADKIRHAGLALDNAVLEFSGNTKKQDITAQVKGVFGQLALQAKTGYDQEWVGQIDGLNLSSSPFGSWKQREKAVFRVGKNEGALGKLCMSDGSGTLCASGDLRWQEKLDWRFDGTFSAVPLNILNNLKLLTIPVQGTFDGEISAAGENYLPLTARAKINVPIIDLELDAEDEEFNSIVFEDTAVNLVLADASLQTNLSTRMKNGSRLAFRGTTEGRDLFSVPVRTWPLNADLDLQDFDLSILSALSGFGVEPSGRVSSTFSLGGSIGKPELVGRGSIQNGGIALPYQGIYLENVQLALTAGEEGAKVVGRATSGAGEVSVGGKLFYGDAGMEGDLHITGRDFLLVNLPEYVIRINPDVRLLLARKMVTIGGSVRVPYALITPEEMKDSVKISKDVLLETGRQEEEAAGWPFALNLDVLLGDDVRIRGYGLTGRLAGQLQVKTTREEVPTAKGEFNLLDGVYTIYGRTLDIERGRILFTGGPIDNPGLDVRAQKKFGEGEAKSRAYTVGVDISGLLQDLQYHLFSDPYMDDTEILSQMIVGHSLAFSSKEEESLLVSAATTLGLKGGAVLFEGIGGILKLDDFHVEGSSKNENFSLVVGKRLSKDLYLGYDMNLFSNLSQFRVRYDLTRGFAVEYRYASQSRFSSQSHGADLLYTFEK